MRAARRVRLADPSHRPLPGLRRSVVLALATFAALVTLLLPGPALARPANVAGGSVATTGSFSPSSTAHSGRRTRGEQVSAPLSSAAPASTSAADVSAAVAAVAASHGAGPTLTAALPGAPQAFLAATSTLRPPGSVSGTPASLAGARTSRGPPTA